MRTVHFNFRKRLSRRALVRGAGVALTLPWLEAMLPAFARGPEDRPRRLVAVSNALGFHAPNLFPEQPGRGYKPSLYLQPLSDLLNDLTIFSGVTHPGVNGGHSAEACILTGAPFSRSSTFRNTISLDQLLAKHHGGQTRFPSLVLNATNDTASPSYTANGSMIPAQNSAARLFAKLFVEDTPAEGKKQVDRVKQGRSIMDIVGDDAKTLRAQLGAGDKEKLDSYFTSVRDLESRLAASEDWARKPKPKVGAKAPDDSAGMNDLAARERAMLDVMFLAVQTDSTRFLTMHSGGIGTVQQIPGVSEGYHNLSHHGLDESKIAQLTLVEKALIGVWGDFVRKLKQSREGSETLLDRTMTLLTSNLGNASSHDNKNMPVVLAGGGFKHGQHLAFDRSNNYPLPNLYVQMLQRAGVEARSFASSSAESVRGFESA